MSKREVSIIPNERIESRIFYIRERKVMFDSDLAELYGVETKYLTRQVRRNKERFPGDFMFRLNKGEYLRCQNVTSKRGGRRYLPYVFTEQGIAMLSSVLNSPRSIAVNIAIMRVFVRLKELMISNKDLARKIEDLELKFKDHDEKFVVVFKAIRQLLIPPPIPEKPKEKFGF